MAEEVKEEPWMGPITEHSADASELLDQLGSSLERGLSSDAAKRRIEVEGENMLTPPKQVPEWLKFLGHMTGFFSLLLWSGGILCFVGYALKGEVDNLYLGVVLFTVTFLTGCFSYYQEKQSNDTMNKFKNMMPPMCSVKRDGDIGPREARELVRGDIVYIKGGNKLPADILILEADDSSCVNNAALTGESMEIKRSIYKTDDNPDETQNLAFFGTEMPMGKMTGVVIRTGDYTRMGKIAKLVNQTEPEPTPINREIHHFVIIVSAVAMVLGVSFFFIGMALGTDLVTNLVFMIGIIVANVPEGLLATVTVSLTLTAQRMAKKSVLVKNLEGVETLGSTSCICSDKTGTLTQNIMTVVSLVYDQKISRTGLDSNEKSYDQEDATFKKLFRCAAICNNAFFVEASKKDSDGNAVPFKKTVTLGDGSSVERVAWQTDGDASESALIKFCQELQPIEEARAEWELLPEGKGAIPFNSRNKYQASVHRSDGVDNFLMVMKGAPERIIARCDRYMADGEIHEFTPEEKAVTEALQLELSKEGQRVLGFAEQELDAEDYPADYEFTSNPPNFPLGESEENYQKQVDLYEKNTSGMSEADKSAPDAPKYPSERMMGGLVFLGLMAMIDPPRTAVPGAVAKCKSAGIKVVMVTGDHPATAKAIAHQVGILWGPTTDDQIEANEAAGLSEGDEGWVDPDLAPAVVVPGWVIKEVKDEAVWDDWLEHEQIVFARTSPEQKLQIVSHFQDKGYVVAVTGDGVNDSPALRKGDIGIAMGIMGSEVTKEAADMILLDDNFASIVNGVEEGRLIFDNLKKSIAYTLSSNIPEISPFLVFITVQTPLPLSTVLILCVDLGTDMVPAISMAYENAESDIMKRNPRNKDTDHLVTRKLVSFSYLQIGVIQALAGFFTWIVVLNDFGFPPHVLPGLGAFDNWGKQQLFCKVTGGQWVNFAGKTSPTDDYMSPIMFSNGTFSIADNVKDEDFYVLWDAGSLGVVDECTYAVKNYVNTDATRPDAFRTAPKGFTEGLVVPTWQSTKALLDEGYKPFTPFAARKSPFWNNGWLQAEVTNGDYAGGGDLLEPLVFFTFQPYGMWIASGSRSGDLARGMGQAFAAIDDNRGTYSSATFVPSAITDISSRMVQKEALHHAQCALFISIIIVQWADLMICKTRWLSITQQGMRNSTMNFGLYFETLLGSFLCYVPAMSGLGTRPLRLTHWFPGFFFMLVIFAYDETRKSWMRSTSPAHTDPATGKVVRKPGWLERNTYY
eukprot:PLAT10305.1.p2 GENE.PLAT10305.1~~PLAT10305.1.p2  ORF type:complete len:1254 (+),score=546.52 PLAT10305.1:2369-6130(+)